MQTSGVGAALSDGVRKTVSALGNPFASKRSASKKKHSPARTSAAVVSARLTRERPCER